MTNKIVAISDVHLGQSGEDTYGQYSLLSARSKINLVREFKAAVHDYAAGDKVSLVVVGDFLDLSMSFIEDALTDLRELLTALDIDEIVYVVGNHDIELWSLHCEDKNLLTSLRIGDIPPASSRDPNRRGLYKTTAREGEPFKLLQPLVDRIYSPRKVPIKIAYPSYTVELPNGTLIYFLHGNLLGGIYTTISDILQEQLKARPLERVAATVNQPVIGLIYWLLGEMGEGMGVDGLIEHVYTDIQKGDGRETEQIVKHAVDKLFANGLVNGLPDRMERWVIEKVAMRLLRKHLPAPEKVGVAKDRNAEIAKTEDELKQWIERVPLLHDRMTDLSHPTHVVTGHTHVRDRHLYDGTAVTGWNLGGWLVEPPAHVPPSTCFLGVDGDGKATWIPVT